MAEFGDHGTAGAPPLDPAKGGPPLEPRNGWVVRRGLLGGGNARGCPLLTTHPLMGSKGPSAPLRVRAEPGLPYGALRRARGSMNCGSVSQGNRIHVSWETSVTKLSTAGRPAGLA